MDVQAEARTLGVPEGVTLAPDEHVVATGSFVFSNLLFFLHWKMAVTTKRLVGQTPNTILGIIPLGSTQVSYPLANIAGVTTRTAYSFLWLLIGVVLLLAGIAQPNVILLIIGVLALLAAFSAEISVTNSGGERIGHRVAIFNRAKATAFVQQVNAAIAAHAHQTVVVTAATTTVTSVPTTSDALGELGRLRDAGHLSSEEYEAKRREIIGRL
jgi:hypothetical protein